MLPMNKEQYSQLCSCFGSCKIASLIAVERMQAIVVVLLWSLVTADGDYWWIDTQAFRSERELNTGEVIWPTDQDVIVVNSFSKQHNDIGSHPADNDVGTFENNEISYGVDFEVIDRQEETGNSKNCYVLV